MASRIEKLSTDGFEVKLKIVSAIYSHGMPETPAFDEMDLVPEYDECEEFEDSPLDDGAERIEQVTLASYSDDGGRVTITYDDSEVLDTPQTTTQVTFSKAEPGLISIVRSGGLSGMIVIEEGRHHTGDYRIGPYSLPVAFYGKRVKNTLKDGEGKLELDYTVEIGGADAQRTKMTLTVTK